MADNDTPAVDSGNFDDMTRPLAAQSADPPVTVPITTMEDLQTQIDSMQAVDIAELTAPPEEPEPVINEDPNAPEPLAAYEEVPDHAFDDSATTSMCSRCKAEVTDLEDGLCFMCKALADDPAIFDTSKDPEEG